VNQFDELVEEGHAAHDALLKIFTKKIKRSKKKDEGTTLQSTVNSTVYSVCMASVKNVVLQHGKAHCVTHSLACSPRVYEKQAFEHSFDVQTVSCTCLYDGIERMAHCMMLSMHAFFLVPLHFAQQSLCVYRSGCRVIFRQ